MDVFETAQQVVHDGLDVAFCQVELAAVDLPEVGGRRLEHQVQRLECLRVLRLEDVVELHDVAMLGQLAQDEHLTEHALGIGNIREKFVDFLNSDAFAGDAVDGKYYVTEAARADLLYECVCMSNTELHLETILFGDAWHLQLWLLSLGVLVTDVLSCVIYYRNKQRKFVSKLDHFSCRVCRFLYTK